MVRKCYTGCQRVIFTNFEELRRLTLRDQWRHFLILQNILNFFSFLFPLEWNQELLKSSPKKVVGEGRMTSLQLLLFVLSESWWNRVKGKPLAFCLHTRNKTAFFSHTLSILQGISNYLNHWVVSSLQKNKIFLLSLLLKRVPLRKFN